MTIASLVLVAGPCLVAASLPPGDHLRSLTVGGVSRSYVVHVPPGLDPNAPAPVVLAFHSAVMNATMMAEFSGLSEKADRSGFVVVYPNGTGSSRVFLFWDAGGVRGQPSDDVGFVARLLDELPSVLKVDPHRVFATGMSNGAMMCYRLASELSDRIAAIAPVAGPMATESCRPRRPVSVIHFHGTKDPLVPFGGPNDRTAKSLSFKSVADSIRAWVTADGCPATPTVATPEPLVDDGTRIRRESYGPGREGSEVILYVIEGGGHTWPGRDPRFRSLGRSTKNLSANDRIWEFFLRHPFP